MGSIGSSTVRNMSYEEWTDADAKREYSTYDYDVTSKEWKATTKYTGGQYYIPIQQALFSGEMMQDTYRDGRLDMSPYIKALDDSMRPLSANVELSRAILYDQWKNSVGVDVDTVQRIVNGVDTSTKALDKTIGKSFNIKGFTSTSYNENQNATPEGQVLLKLQTPKGTQAIVTNNKMESEIILHRNLKYKITGYRVRDLGGNRKQIVFTAKVLN